MLSVWKAAFLFREEGSWIFLQNEPFCRDAQIQNLFFVMSAENEFK